MLAATATSNRKCSPTLSCTPTEFETRAPTATSDRACEKARVCDFNPDPGNISALPYPTDAAAVKTFELVALTKSADRVCQNYTVCNWATHFYDRPYVFMVSLALSVQHLCSPLQCQLPGRLASWGDVTRLG